ncbi:MAG: hypothetical protein CMQ05_06540 [Gammaproteobacteria bacterium]|uniref:Endolytic murein transglycosylase n=1 Tax=OM182 bacterium MED-G24 TaxID=1986255 RepID=A0A2A5WSI6_9GAMM|nr:hypothetical protein [Gammaproteobacteria bacterium]PDH39096.1 MAG: hypothetical protein CNE99_06185 [OM182 bacterium MED-G24]RPG26373.1 MAG: endolytic transglycosylase MltG [Gammaproteobacteria bacterium TMED50]
MSVMKQRLLGTGLVSLSILAVGLGTAMILFGQYARQPLNVENDGVIHITPGMSVTHLAKGLSEKEIISSSDSFYYYVRVANWVDDSSIKAGEYEVRPGETVGEAVIRFQAGDVIQHRLTFPEGLTISQWRDHMRAQPGIVATKHATDMDLMRAIEPGIDYAPEGMFYPDTYYYRRGDSELSVLRRAYLRMKSVLSEEWQNRGETPLATAYETLILASIVEKETGLSSERKMIASVFVNRLRQGQRLESDPTVIYGIPDFDGDITRQHLRTTTPYNTYRRHGLPPTPICSPGRAAINAVLNPALSDYFYFVSRGDGSSQFSRTLEEHQAAVRRYQLGTP